VVVWVCNLRSIDGLVSVKVMAWILWMMATMGVQIEIHRFANTLPMSGILTITIMVAFYYIYGFVQIWIKEQ